MALFRVYGDLYHASDSQVPKNSRHEKVGKTSSNEYANYRNSREIQAMSWKLVLLSIHKRSA